MRGGCVALRRARGETVRDGEAMLVEQRGEKTRVGSCGAELV